jgi:hypothetical protein
MMTYFEIRGRLEHLLEFRRLYHEYAEFTNKENNLPAQLLLSRLEPMVSLTVNSLRQVGLGTVVTRDAPSKGGRRIRVNIIKAIFRPLVVRHFSIEDSEILSLLDRGLVKYRIRLWQQRLQLLNPLFWLYQIIAFAADLPLWIFRAAGYTTEHIEKAAPTRVYKVAVQILLFAALLHWSGVFTWIRFDIFAL